MTPPLWLDVPIRIGGDEARGRAADELAKAKYGGTPAWLLELSDRAERVIERLAELYARYLESRAGSGGVNLGLIIVVVILLLLIALVVWRVGLPKWRRTRAVDGSVDSDSSVAPAGYRTLAEGCAAEGRWRDAVRERFRAMVRELEERTILDVRPARTAWETAYLASRTLPDAAQVLHDAAERFNGVVYGQQPADAAAYQQMVQSDLTVTAAAAATDLTEEPVGA